MCLIVTFKVKIKKSKGIHPLCSQLPPAAAVPASRASPALTNSSFSYT